MSDNPGSEDGKSDGESVPSLSRTTSRSIAIASWGPGSGGPGSGRSDSGSPGSPLLGVLTPFGGILAGERWPGRPRSVSLSYLVTEPYRGPRTSTRSVVEAGSAERAGGAQSDQRTVVVDRQVTERTGAGEGTAERAGERTDRGDPADSKPDLATGRTRVVQVLRDEGAEGDDGSRGPTETGRDEGRNRRFRLPATDRDESASESTDRGETFSDRVTARASAPDSARRGTTSSATEPGISLQVVDRMRGGDRDRKAGGDVGPSGGSGDDATGRDDAGAGVVRSPDRTPTAGSGDDRERSGDRPRGTPESPGGATPRRTGTPDLTWRREGTRPDARRRGKTGRSRKSQASEAAGRRESERETADESAARDRGRGGTRRSGDGADRSPESGEISLADVDTGRLVDRLYRELERKRRIERERRGL